MCVHVCFAAARQHVGREIISDEYTTEDMQGKDSINLLPDDPIADVNIGQV